MGPRLSSTSEPQRRICSHGLASSAAQQPLLGELWHHLPTAIITSQRSTAVAMATLFSRSLLFTSLPRHQTTDRRAEPLGSSPFFPSFSVIRDSFMASKKRASAASATEILLAN